MIGSLIGGIFGKMGGDAAASAATEAANQQREANALARRDLSPWRSAGGAATNEVSQLLGLGALVSDENGQMVIATDPATGTPLYREGLQLQARNRFMADPGYQFRVAEGEKGINRSLAAKTGVLNGAAVKAAATFNQDQASQEYGNYFNRMMGLAGLGGSAAATSANAGVVGAKAAGDDLVAAGKARQSGYDALGKGISSGINNLAGFGSYQGWW